MKKEIPLNIPFLKSTLSWYVAFEAPAKKLLQMCDIVERLIAKDYEYKTVANSNPELCGTYPEKIFIMTRDKNNHDAYSRQSVNDKTKWKDVMYQVTLTSSEKADDLNRYKDFKLNNIPMPGCEFFRGLGLTKYNGQKLIFRGIAVLTFLDWADAKLATPSSKSPPLCSKKKYAVWKKHKHWNLVEMTTNYLKLLLDSAVDDQGVLIHCISGWDRTPMYISLMRLSLWADGLIHKSLSPIEILTLTLGYDWILFRHKFWDRYHKEEEIMAWTFIVLDVITDEYFSLPTEDSQKLEKLNSENISERVQNAKEEDLETIHPGKQAKEVPRVSRKSLGDIEIGSWSIVDVSEYNPVFKIESGERSQPHIDMDVPEPTIHSVPKESIEGVEVHCESKELPQERRKSQITNRKEKLLEVRRLFLKAYTGSFPKKKDLAALVDAPLFDGIPKEIKTDLFDHQDVRNKRHSVS